MDEEYYKLLVQRYSEKKCTDAELEVFTHLLNEGKLDKYLTASMDKELGLQQDTMPQERPARIISFFRRWQVAASILLCLALSLYLAIRYHHSDGPATARQSKQIEIKPGGNNAILTLGNGETIVLNKAKDGQLAKQGSSTINKTSNGQIVYAAQPAAAAPSAAAAPPKIIYNSITTPAGGQYQLVLADGTKVWLNSLSSIKYPAHFDGAQRTVEITGEAYFEVAPNKTAPFKVISSSQTIEVLSTQFNINAYADEPSTKTTLLEGKIRVTGADANKAAILVPGQQSATSSGSIAVTTADTEEAIAWKNGYFEFHNTDVRSMMRQITRWYNIPVDFAPTFTERKFTGGISREVNLSSVLTMLKYAGIQVNQQGNTITIIK